MQQLSEEIRTFFLTAFGVLATWVRFPSPAPTSVPIIRIKCLVGFSSLKNGVLLTRTASVFKHFHYCLRVFKGITKEEV